MAKGGKEAKVCGSPQGATVRIFLPSSLHSDFVGAGRVATCALSHRNYWPTTFGIGRLAYPGINAPAGKYPPQQCGNIGLSMRWSGVNVQAVFRRLSCLPQSLPSLHFVSLFHIYDFQQRPDDLARRISHASHIIAALDKLMLITETQFYRYTYPERYTYSKLS